MHTEHLNNVGFVRVIVGWLIAVAVASLLMLAVIGFGVISPDATTGGWAGMLIMVLGFGMGGFFAGFRALRAPILHGIAIGLTSLVAAAAFAFLNDLVSPDTRWTDLRASAVILLVFAQFASAVIGALVGYNLAVRGKPGLGEPDVPELG